MMQTLLISELLTGNVRDPLIFVRVTSDGELEPAGPVLYVGRVQCSASALTAVKYCANMQIQNPAVMSVDLVLSWCEEDISAELRADEMHIKDVQQNITG